MESTGRHLCAPAAAYTKQDGRPYSIAWRHNQPRLKCCHSATATAFLPAPSCCNKRWRMEGTTSPPHIMHAREARRSRTHCTVHPLYGVTFLPSFLPLREACACAQLGEWRAPRAATVAAQGAVLRRLFRCW